MSHSRWAAADPAMVDKAARIAALVSDLKPVEKQQFSFARAIRHMAGMEQDENCLEQEFSIAMAQQLGRSTAGMFLPTRLYAAGLDTKTNAAGAYTVATEVRDLIELLRNKCCVIQLGATVLSGLHGNVAFPTQASATTGSWVSQNPGSDVAASDATFGQKLMSPKTYQATTSFSRQLLAQSSLDVEALVRNDLALAHALAIDLAAINGSGTSNQPKGILGTTGIGSVAVGASGGALTYELMVDLETAVAVGNADVPGMKFLTTPEMRGKLRKIQVISGTTAGIPVWQSAADGTGSVNGYRADVSNQVPKTLTKGANNDCHAVIFGYWPSCLIGEWGVIEIVVDPFTMKRQGLIEATSFQMVDVLVRQPAQFAAIQDARLV
jgi:HK97 family phage major capsid protein